MPNDRVLVAMSGGVDSSVTAALLLREGYQCLGATMRLAANEDDSPGSKTCCSLDDVEDAREVCWGLGIPYHVFDYTEEFERCVVRPFVGGYAAGETPSPCVACNRYLKFGALLDRALELGCDHLATGHYARVTCDDGRWHLLKGIDPAKDQSYFLCGLGQRELAHVLFPLGGMVKATEVRPLAEELGLTTAEKRDSEGVCFVPGGDLLGFLASRGEATDPGDIVDREGRRLGTHEGALRYTIGQRKGLGVAANRPLYVCATDVQANTVTLGPTEALVSRGLEAREWNWVSGQAPASPIRVGARVRYHQPDQAATLAPLGDGRVRIDFDEAQRAIAPGQVAVAYIGDELLGGGVIDRAIR